MREHPTGKKESKYVKAEKMVHGFNIERGKKFLQVEGTKVKGIFISHKGYIMEK